MKFDHVAAVFDQLEATSSRLEMTRLLADLFAQASAHEAKIIAYLALGELQPPYIGTQFQLADKSMVPVVAQLLDVSSETVKKHQHALGDLGSVVATGSWRNKHALTLEAVYDRLLAVEKISGTGSQEKKAEEVLALLGELSPGSAKYVVRVVIGSLRLGFSDMTIVDALSWMLVGDKSVRAVVEQAYNVCADIGMIAQVAKEKGVKGLEQCSIVVGIPIRPAAAERLPTAADIVKKLGHCVAQAKLDGFRLQIHIDKRHKQPVVRFFSRNLVDMSAMFPDLVAAFLTLDVETLICEGEAIVYDPNTGGFMPFQETVKRKRKHDIEQAAQDLPLQVFLFDVLYLNGKSLMDKTHAERRKLLLNLLSKRHDATLQAIEEVAVSSAQELEDYFLGNIEKGLEGVVVKKPDAIYQPGKRNFNWIKLKRQEEGHLEDTLDCVVLGYYAGQGKRAQFGIGAFLVGIYDKKQDRFETVAKVGTGLTDKEWVELKHKCDKIKAAEMPHNIICAKDLYPDVWVYPEIVVQIRADEVTISPLHTAGKTKEKLGFALRFPRFMGYRPDKSAIDSTELHEVASMYKHQKQENVT